jgi:hypothetical protein
VREVALDNALMHQVVVGVPLDGVNHQNQLRCEAAAQQWWELVLELARRRLGYRDQQMVAEYMRRSDLG